MTTEMPLRLKLRTAPANTDAFLLLTDSTALLVMACSSLPQWPAIHRVDGGFLIVSANGSLPAAAIRLRRLGGDFYIPANANLLPTLLTDEFVGLTRQQGLIALPGGALLAFDPQRSLTPSDCLTPLNIRRSAWQPFPAREPRPDRLTVIEGPEPTPAAVIESLREGQPEGAEPLPGPEESNPIPEAARPPSASLGQRILAGAAFAAAQAMALAGRLFKNPKLAGLAARLARQAVERVPRISEKLLGAQEAALRHILKQLQSGNIEDALRRAPVAVPDPDRPARVGADARLATVDPRYSLRSLIGKGGGPATTWLGGGDVWAQLAAEYRRLAQDALRRGDHRRAAYLYGVLLRDLRSAANALASGGLHRDAAILFRDKLNDLAAAAREFERAGDIDEAVRLYDRQSLYEEAGELLRRAGDEDRAGEYFHLAAERHAANNRWVAAGDLARAKLGDHGLACKYYFRGWSGNGPELASCGTRLLDEHIVAEDWSAVRKHLQSAEHKLQPPRSAEAAQFFNTALRVGELLPENLREELSDSARVLFAEHLRSTTKGVHLAEQLFARGNPWSAAIVRDALYAARQEGSRHEEPAFHEPPVKVSDGRVVAAIAARESRDLIIATTTNVICWRVDTGQVRKVMRPSRRVLGLATNPDATAIYVLYAQQTDIHLQCWKELPTGWQIQGTVSYQGEGSASGWHLSAMEPKLASRGELLVGLTDVREHVQFKGPHLEASATYPELRSTNCLLRADDPNGQGLWTLDEDGLAFQDSTSSAVGRMKISSEAGQLGFPNRNGLAIPPFDYRTASGELELAVVTLDGALIWLVAEYLGGELKHQSFATATCDAGYVAAALTHADSVVAATRRNEIHWFTAASRRLIRIGSQELKVPSPIVYVFTRNVNEVVVVLSDGSLVRVRRP